MYWCGPSTCWTGKGLKTFPNLWRPYRRPLNSRQAGDGNPERKRPGAFRLSDPSEYAPSNNRSQGQLHRPALDRRRPFLATVLLGSMALRLTSLPFSHWKWCFCTRSLHRVYRLLCFSGVPQLFRLGMDRHLAVSRAANTKRTRRLGLGCPGCDHLGGDQDCERFRRGH